MQAVTILPTVPSCITLSTTALLSITVPVIRPISKLRPDDIKAPANVIGPSIHVYFMMEPIPSLFSSSLVVSNFLIIRYKIGAPIISTGSAVARLKKTGLSNISLPATLRATNCAKSCEPYIATRSTTYAKPILLKNFLALFTASLTILIPSSSKNSLSFFSSSCS